MTHKEIIEKAAKWLKHHKRNAIVSNCPVIATDMVSLNYTGEVPDVIGFNYSYSILIEVKTSWADFVQDFMKPFRMKPELGMGQFRYYCCHPGIINENDLPGKWGLLWCDDKGRIEIIKVAEKQFANLLCERTLLLSIIRRMKN